jgi:cell division protein FtsW (lipid II flippase)
VLGLALFLGGAIAASRILPYVGARFDAWLDSFNPAIYDQQGGSYQLVQGLFGLANGGLVGTGLGRADPTSAARGERLHHREPRRGARA